MLAVLLFFAALLVFREQKLPDVVVDALARKLSVEGFPVKIASATFGFRHGLGIRGVKVADLSKPDGLQTPLFSAESISIFPVSRVVRIRGAEYPRLPDSWYMQATNPPVLSKLDFEIPELPDFTLVLEKPAILGIEPLSVRAKVSTAGGRAVFDDVEIDMPDRDSDSHLEGRWVLDGKRKRLDGNLQGTVKPDHIRPLLVALDIPTAVEYMVAFTDTPGPVPSSLTLSAGLETQDVSLRVGLSPKLGRYNGVPLERAEGAIVFDSRIPEGAASKPRTPDWEWRDNSLRIELPYAIDSSGRRLEGRVGVSNASGFYRAEYTLQSALDFVDIARIADIVDPSLLECVECDTPPELTMSGKSATQAEDFAANDLHGEAKLERGSICGYKVQGLDGVWNLKGDKLDFSAGARGKTGGRISLEGKVDFGGFAEFGETLRYSAKCTYKGGSLEETADVFPFDPGRRSGKLDGWIELSGNAGTNALRSICGKGSFKIHDGKLAQARIFAGLTELLAEKVIGVAFLVNQTDASADFTIKDGVLKTDNIYLEGGLVSVKGWGTYDLAADKLDFTIRVQLLRKDSLAGRITHTVTFPFAKMLLEFKLEGSAADPKWHYIQPLERIF